MHQGVYTPIPFLQKINCQKRGISQHASLTLNT